MLSYSPPLDLPDNLWVDLSILGHNAAARLRGYLLLDSRGLPR